MSERTDRSGAGRWIEWLPAAVLCALGWMTAWKIMSYATGQDPRIYLHFAENIRHDGYSLASIARCAHWVVPGYPLLLAGVLDTLGIFAAYWINLPIFFLGAGLLAKVLRRFASPGEAGLAMLVFFWIAVTGHPLNPHFLFLPFRGILEWTWMFGALALMAPAFDPALPDGLRCRRAAETALWLMAGALFRETIVFLVVPFGWICLWQGVRGDRGAWKGLAALAAPLGLAALALVGWKWLHQEPLMNSQANRWMVGLMRGGFAKPFPVLLADIVRTIFGELGVFGTVFLAIGTGWAVVRREKTVFTLWATSLLLVLFYAVYKSHVRYTLSAVGLLALVAGWGFAATLSAATRRLRPEWRRGVFAAAALAVVGLTLQSIAGMETWGPRVTRADVKALQAHPLVSAPGVFIEKERRYMVDALLAFTSVAPRDPIHEQRSVRTLPGAFFLSPADDQGAFGVPQGVTSEDWLRHHFDFEKQEPDLTFGGARFEVYRMVPPSRTTVAFAVEADSASAGTLWLDFRSGVASGEVNVAVGEDETRIFALDLPHPAGLIPLRVPAGLPEAGKRVLTVKITSNQPLLADETPKFTPDGQTQWFTMEQGRLPSVEAWKGEGFERRTMDVKHGAILTSNAVLRIPMPVGDEKFEVLCNISLNLRPQPTSSEEISGHVGLLDLPEALNSWKIPPGKATQVISWQKRVKNDEKQLILGISAEKLPENCYYLRLEDVGVSFSALP